MEIFQKEIYSQNKDEILIKNVKKILYTKLYTKYTSKSFSYNIISINNIIFNEPCLIVAKFKDFLIYDDNTEFFRKFYPSTESIYKLYKILDLYENYSKIFPNYLVVKERKFMYKNIRRKQKMIDAFNQIKLEEEENRKKIKEKQNDSKEDNKLFTDIVKDEIKYFQKDNTIKNFKNSFDSDNDKEDTLFGRSRSSVSFNLMNKKEFISSEKQSENYNKGLSFDSIKTTETNGTISGLLNIMNDNKIYIKDLPNLFKVYYYPNNDNIKQKMVSIGKNVNKIYKGKKANKNGFTSINNFILQKLILTPKKKKTENIEKNNFNLNFNSSSLTKKNLQMFNPTLINSNSNSIINEIKNKEKVYNNKNGIIIPSIENNTIININNNFYQGISKTERFDEPKQRKLSNLTKRSNLIYSNILKSSSREKDSSNIKRSLNLNNRLLSGQKISTFRSKYEYVKLKHISHDFSNKKHLEPEFSNRISTTNNIVNRTKRILSPQISIGLNKRKIDKDEKNKNINLNKNIKNNKNNHIMNLNLDSYNYINKNKNALNIKDSSYREKEYLKININQNYKKSKEKNTKLVKKNKACLSRENKKKLFTLINNPKFNANEYSSISFVNITKTESNINNQTFNYINKNKRLNTNNNNNTNNTNNESQNQKTFFNLVKNKKISKDLFLHDKFFTTFNNSKESKEQTKISQNDIFNIFQKTSESCYSKDKDKEKEKNNKNVKRLYIKSTILKTENRILSERNIYNHANKMKNKNNKSNNSEMEKFNKNNNIEYTTIFSNTKNNVKNILCPKSIKKKKKCESTDFSNNNDNNNHKKLILKFESLKRNTFINSPKNSLSQFISGNIINKNRKAISDYFNEKISIVNQTLNPKNHKISSLNQNDMKLKYKNFILTKNNKKSYDFNSEVQTRYKQNILNKINSIKNKNSCILSIRKNSNSIDLNNINYSNFTKYYTNTFKNKSKEKDKESYSKDLFKKVLTNKIVNKNRKEEKLKYGNNNVNSGSNTLPFTIKVNTSNFLSKFKGKYKKE